MRDVEFKTDSIDILSAIDEDGNKITEFKEEDLEIEEDNTQYISIIDEGERGVREADRRLDPPCLTERPASGIYVNTPKAFSWSAIGTAIVFVATLAFNVFSLYDRQVKFNERTTEVLQRHRDEISNMKDTMITRKEEELKLQNLEVKLNRLEELIRISKEDIDRLETEIK